IWYYERNFYGIYKNSSNGRFKPPVTAPHCGTLWPPWPTAEGRPCAERRKALPNSKSQKRAERQSRFSRILAISTIGPWLFAGENTNGIIQRRCRGNKKCNVSFKRSRVLMSIWVLISRWDFQQNSFSRRRLQIR